MTGPRGNRGEGDGELTCVVEMRAAPGRRNDLVELCRESVPRALRGGCRRAGSSSTPTIETSS